MGTAFGWRKQKTAPAAVRKSWGIALTHGISNAASESLNSKIQWVKYTARGFRNFQNFVTSIYFHCGGLNLTPSPT